LQLAKQLEAVLAGSGFVPDVIVKNIRVKLAEFFLSPQMLKGFFSCLLA
jgi:hypothetical protein